MLTIPPVAYLRIMALYREWEINNTALAAIWHIEEPESFFAEGTGIDTTIKSEKRRIEHLCGRYLLKHLKEDIALHKITPDEHDKPRIENNEPFFSISHSWPYVAAVVDTHGEAGIDIQVPHERIQTIQHKFLSEDEQGLFKNRPELITIGWCAKEAVYKWQGRRGIEFIEGLPITHFKRNAVDFDMSIYSKITVPAKMIHINGFDNQQFTCAWVEGWQAWEIY